MVSQGISKYRPPLQVCFCTFIFLLYANDSCTRHDCRLVTIHMPLYPEILVLVSWYVSYHPYVPLSRCAFVHSLSFYMRIIRHRCRLLIIHTSPYLEMLIFFFLLKIKNKLSYPMVFGQKLVKTKFTIFRLSQTFFIFNSLCALLTWTQRLNIWQL